MASPLTPDQIVEQFESLADDALDETTEYFLLNEVKDDLECDEEWKILKTLDETQSANPGDTYLTMKTLPADFGLPSQDGIYVGTDVLPYIEVPFEDRIRWQFASHRYYIDEGSGTYAICGSPNPGGTIHFFYQKTSATLAKDGAAWIFPARFHPILPMLMVRKFFAIDQPDKARAWDDRWTTWITEKQSIMRRWNARAMLQANSNSNRPVDISSYPNIINMDADSGGSGVYG